MDKEYKTKNIKKQNIKKYNNKRKNINKIIKKKYIYIKEWTKNI